MSYTATMPEKNKPVRISNRVTQVCRDLLDKLMRRNGLSESAVIEVAVRKYAASEGITYPDADIRPAPSPQSSNPDNTEVG